MAYDPASGEWQQHEDLPDVFTVGQIAHDSVRDRIVAYGRTIDVGVSDLTYEWDGASWQTFDHPIWNPYRRRGHGMLWIEPLGVVFMYGGDITTTEDTWFLTRVP